MNNSRDSSRSKLQARRLDERERWGLRFIGYDSPDKDFESLAGHGMQGMDRKSRAKSCL